jgi:hypothetical protein
VFVEVVVLVEVAVEEEPDFKLNDPVLAYPR